MLNPGQSVHEMKVTRCKHRIRETADRVEAKCKHDSGDRRQYYKCFNQDHFYSYQMAHIKDIVHEKTRLLLCPSQGLNPANFDF